MQSSVSWWLLGFAACAVLQGGCASNSAHPAPMAAESPFVADVTDEEWQAAIPIKGSSIELPRLIRGTNQPNAEGVLKLQETAITTVAMLIRADGSVGLYRIVKSTNARMTDRIVRMLRAQRYEPPLLEGRAVAVRGEVTHTLTRTD